MSDPSGPGQDLPPAADVILSSVHLLVTIGFERTGLRPGSPRDLGETELAVEGVRALLPVLERLLPPDGVHQYRQALADLQMAYAEAVAGPAAAAPPPADEPAVDTPPRPKIWTPRGDV